MRITAVDSPPLFVGTAAAPLQVVRVSVDSAGRPAPITVSVHGPGVATAEPFRFHPAPAPAGGPPRRPGEAGVVVAEAPVRIAAPHRPGSRIPVTAIAESPGERAEFAAEIAVAEPGWTMWMVSHFHYDPVWWDTQGEFTQSRLLLPDERGALPDVRTAFDLVRLHLDAARSDPDYKFVLAEVDYLKPYFDTRPQDRADLRRLLAEGRVEIVGGNYNEPNTNLTSAESTIRNAVHGIAHQRDVRGGDPRTAWMLDAFGHDPAYPGIMAAAGLTSSAWARGPYHQWGPQRTVGDNTRMQFPSEFEWLSPDGRSLLTSYMPNHYAAGWATHAAADAAAAQAAALQQFTELAPVAATRNVLLPVGADHVIPSRWVTAIHREWNARYLWPRFVTAIPREFFAAVRADAAERGVWLTPQTRDMNPVYPGKDVTYIDTKQAQRAAEAAVEDGERLATLAWLAGADYPAPSLDKAWRLLVFGAHHDAITGTESDQVYLDLLAGWREAFERGDAARREAAAHLLGLARTIPPPAVGRDGPTPRPVAVVNTLSWPRTALATITLDLPEPGWPWLALRDGAGTDLPFLAEGARRRADGTLSEVTVTFRAQVPALGYRIFWAAPAPGPGREGWQAEPGAAIANETFAASADPARGGALASLRDLRTGAELLRGPGNELVLQREHPSHPRWGEGQWLLSPKGPGAGSADVRAEVRAERCPIGRRLVARFDFGGLRVVQETVLWDGARRVEFRTHLDGSIGDDTMLRVRFPADVPGGLPVYQSAACVIGRPFGIADADVAEHPFTLDNPAHEWFALGSTTRVRAGGETAAIGVAEVILPDPGAPGRPGWRAAVRDLVAALAARGATATCSAPDGPRYGALDVDSNLPDVRIALGGPERNSWTARLLAEAGPQTAAALARLDCGRADARLWVPAARPRSAVFTASADVRGTRDLPVLVVAGDDVAAAVADLTADLADAVVEAAAAGPPSPDPPLADRVVALLNRGTPSSVVTPDGTLHITLMRASGAWPAGVWIDGERRTAPDGSSFAWQHWSHTFEYALAAGAGDWREAGLAPAGQDYNRDLLALAVDAHDGPLPALASLCEVDSPGLPRPAAMLAALKPRGEPLASGRPGRPAPEAGVTIRLRDAGPAVAGPGVPAGPPAARVRLFTGIAAARHTDALEARDGPPVPVAHGAATVEAPVAGLLTLALAPAGSGLPAGPAAGPAARPRRPSDAGPPEPAQPVFARYWLHGKGPAPAGNLPVAAHVSPERITLGAPGARAALAVTVACGPEPAAGLITLDVPAGLAVSLPDGSPAGALPYQLPPDGHARWDLLVRADPGALPGRYFVAARSYDEHGQMFEDAALVTLGEPGPPPLDLPLDSLVPLLLADRAAAADEVAVELLPAGLSLAAGQAGEFLVEIANHTAGPIRGESQLICPFGAWTALGPPARGFSAGPGERVALRYPVRAPAAARAGAQWWALAKVMYFGRVRHSPAVAVAVTP